MKGSIRFNPDINIEVDADPSAEEGARLVSAKNLVDGQELGIGGGSDLPEVTSADEGKVLAVNASGEWAAENKIMIVKDTEGAGNFTYNDLLSALNAGSIIYYINTWEDGAIASILIGLNYDGEFYYATFGDSIFSAELPTENMVIAD